MTEIDKFIEAAKSCRRSARHGDGDGVSLAPADALALVAEVEALRTELQLVRMERDTERDKRDIDHVDTEPEAATLEGAVNTVKFWHARANTAEAEAAELRERLTDAGAQRGDSPLL